MTRNATKSLAHFDSALRNNLDTAQFWTLAGYGTLAKTHNPQGMYIATRQ